MDFEQAKREFERYLDDYDRTDDKINLKIVHTYGVVDCSEAIAGRMGLSREDVELAKLIGLLHDIGRFEQLKLYDSFKPDTMNHAEYGADILFKDGMIRRFIEENTWDSLIETAIRKHSDYLIEGVSDARTLLHAKLIRDADKLDNCRVKLEEKISTMINVDEEYPKMGKISESVWASCRKKESVRALDRVTPADYWVSYVAYFYDIYFPETMEIILEKQFTQRIIHRFEYEEEDTREKLAQLEKQLLAYAENCL